MKYIDVNEFNKYCGESLKKLDNRYDIYFFKAVKQAILENDDRMLRDLYFSDYLPSYSVTNERTLVSGPRRVQILEIMKTIYYSPLRKSLSPESKQVIKEILEAGIDPRYRQAKFNAPSHTDEYRNYTYDVEVRRERDRERKRKQRALIKGE